MPSPSSSRADLARLQRRITKEDVRLAGLRRWDGRNRVTTDWLNLYHEPELCFPDGDCLIYLREPGQSSRGPAFRVHIRLLQANGFHALIDRCVTRPPMPTSAKCISAVSCPGCEKHTPPRELYLPGPLTSDLDATFNHHIDTRNFFAWLYDLPLAGRVLGRSLVALTDKIDSYRHGQDPRTKLDVVRYAEGQKYLDFRECADHALGALHFAEQLQVEDLWIDAFVHCVGLSSQGLRLSIEYPSISATSKSLITEARREMDARLDRVDMSVRTFFEHDLTGNFLGFHQAARDHFDRFRSFLHGFYIEQHGFWPPVGFEDEKSQRSLYASMYSDFRNLYHHLVDTASTTLMGDSALAASGGVCVMQNVQAFDERHHYEPLGQPLPLLPSASNTDLSLFIAQRRTMWNPINKRRAERQARNALNMQVLTEASNRDWNVMNCLLVRRYAEFEAATVLDELESISIVDGRKVRWILIYAVLQTLISVMQAPKQVRNTEGLSYLLCCQVPNLMPWQSGNPEPVPHPEEQLSHLSPDVDYSHTYKSSPSPTMPRVSSFSKKDRSQTFPIIASAWPLNRTISASGTSSLRRMMSRRSSTAETLSPKRPAFCEIYVQGYGNGLNEVDSDSSRADSVMAMESDTSTTKELASAYDSDSRPGSPQAASVSRESSNASSSSAWSKGSKDSGTDISTADASLVGDVKDRMRPISTKLDKSRRASIASGMHVMDERNEMQTVHMNTETWDSFLKM